MKTSFFVILMLFPLTMSTEKAFGNGTKTNPIVLYGAELCVYHDISCFVSFDAKNSSYEINLTSPPTTDDVPDDNSIPVNFFEKSSTGRMTQSNGIIYLTDVGTGMKMQCKQEGNALVFINAPIVLKKLKFDKQKYERIPWFLAKPVDPPKEYNLTTAKKRREELYDKTFDAGGKNIAGNYGTSSSLVSLKKDKTFTIKVFNNIIAKGTWSQDGNIIKMADTDAKCNYYLIIHKDRLGNLRLQSMLIPGDTEGMIL